MAKKPRNKNPQYSFTGVVRIEVRGSYVRDNGFFPIYEHETSNELREYMAQEDIFPLHVIYSGRGRYVALFEPSDATRVRDWLIDQRIEGFSYYAEEKPRAMPDVMQVTVTMALAEAEALLKLSQAAEDAGLKTDRVTSAAIRRVMADVGQKFQSATADSVKKEKKDG